MENKKKLPDRKCIICKKRIEQYEWEGNIFGKKIKIRSDIWCSEECKITFGRILTKLD